MAIKLASLNIGDIIKFRVNGTPTEFIVVHQGLPSTNYDSSCNGTWFLSKYFVSSGAFSSGSNSLSASSGHTYLNTTAYNALDADIKSAIREIKIPYQNGTGTAGSVVVRENGLATRIFLPSTTELGCTAADFAYGTPKEIGAALSYFSGATNATRMATYPDGTAGTWWTRTPDSTSTTKQLIINTNGAGHSFNCTTSNGVRPMFIIPGDKEIELNDDGSYSIVVSKLGDIAEGSKILLNENGAPTEFFVIRHDYQYDLNGRGRTLLMRVKCPNDSTMAWGSGYNYQASKVDTWLNDTYKYRLDSNIIASIGQTTIKTKTSYNSSITQINRFCFLLSSTEYALTTGEGDQLTEASTKKVTTLDSGSTCYLWTRTPASSSAITTLHYTTGGSWTTGPTETYPAVRPAFTLPEAAGLKKNDDGSYSIDTSSLECNRDNVDQKNMLPKAIDENGNIYNGVGYNSYFDESYDTTIFESGYIPVSYGDEIYLRNIILSQSYIGDSHIHGYVDFYDSNFNLLDTLRGNIIDQTVECVLDKNTICTQFSVANFTDQEYSLSISNVAYMKFRTSYIGPDSIVTVNVPIKLSEQKILQYIGATGTQYINTEFIPNNNTRLVADMNLQNTTTTSGALFGSRTASKEQAFALFASNTRFQTDFGNVQAIVTMTTTTGRHIIDKNKNLLYVDGTLKNTLTNNTFTGIYPMYLFQINNGGTAITSLPTTANLYSCQIYDYGPLAKDFIPAQTEDGTVCLYEKISGKYHKNIGTGTFTAGPETGVIINPLMDVLNCAIDDGVPQLNYYSYSSINNYVIERSINNGDFEAIETKTAKIVDSCNYIDEDLGNANSVQYRVKAVSGDYESEYLYTDIYSLYKISTYTNLIVGGVL